MRKYIIYILSILVWSASACSPSHHKSPSAPTKNVVARGYNRKCQVFREIPLTDAKKREILFIGHSLVNEFLVDEFMPHGVEIAYVNMGIGGDDLQGMYARRGLAFDRHPYKMVIEIGVNDFLNEESIDTITTYYTQFIEEALSLGIKLIVCSIIPSMPLYKYKMEEVNAILRNLCVSQDCIFIDLSEMGDLEGSLLPEYDCGDHIHLSGKGYLFWSNKLKPYIYE